MVEAPVVQYADSGDGLIAYQTVGDHPIDLVHIGAWYQTIEGIWELPSAERFYRRLASFARVVLIDRRGTGLSDPLRSRYGGGNFGPWIEEAVADVIVVLDELGSERAVVLSSFYGADVAVSLVATHPRRAAGLVLIDPVVRLLEADDYPWGMSIEMRQQVAEWMRRGWGEGIMSGRTPACRMPAMVPSFRRDPEARRWLARYERAGIARGHMAAWWREWDFDVRPLLPMIQVPTLVMHHDGNVLFDPGAAAAVVSAVSNSTGSLAIASRDLELWASQPAMLADEVERFVTGSVGDRPSPVERAFAVVLYTDLVESTRQTAEVGDRRWREVLEVHNHSAARQIAAHRGRLVKSTGDGVLAVFDAPGRAIRCAQAILAGVRQLGLSARAGLHAGEVELLGEDIAGIAAVIAKRVMDHAGSGEVMVSRTIKDLVFGSGLRFDDRGPRDLKGVPDMWQLFSLAA